MALSEPIGSDGVWSHRSESEKEMKEPEWKATEREDDEKNNIILHCLWRLNHGNRDKKRPSNVARIVFGSEIDAEKDDLYECRLRYAHSDEIAIYGRGSRAV